MGCASAIVLFVGTKKSSLIVVRWETRRRVDVAEHYLQVFRGRCALASLYRNAQIDLQQYPGRIEEEPGYTAERWTDRKLAGMAVDVAGADRAAGPRIHIATLCCRSRIAHLAKAKRRSVLEADESFFHDETMVCAAETAELRSQERQAPASTRSTTD